MSTDLAVYDRISDPLVAIKTLGLSIAQSGTFGTSNNAQGEVLAMECLAARVTPFTLARRFNLISNKLSMKAEAMLTAFNERGGKHAEISSTPDVAEIEITLDGRTKTYSLTWEQCKQEPFIYEGKEGDIVKKLLAGDTKSLTLKPKYSTPRARAQMMWARLVSDTIRKVMPGVICGTYTPEEIEDFDDVPATNGNGNGRSRANGATVKATAPATQSASDPNVIDGEVVSTTTTITTTASKATTTDPGIKLRISTLLSELGITNPGWDVEALTPDAAAKTLKQLEDERLKRLKAGHSGQANGAAANGSAANGSTAATDSCTAQQSDRIKELWGLLNATPEQRDKMLAARNAKTVRNLTATQAAELIGKLETKLASIQPGTPPTDPCGDEMAGKIKERLKEVEQTAPGTIAKFRAMMARGGVAEIKLLTKRDADVLWSALQGNGLEAFFGMTVAQWPTPVDPNSIKLSDADTAVKN